jgi:gliding motility-associated-like protein
VVNNTSTQNYTFTPDANQCATSGQLTIEVRSDVNFEIEGECVENNFTLQVLNGNFDDNTAIYLWQNSALETIGTNAPSFDITSYLNATTAIEQLPLTFNVTVTTSDGCSGTQPFVVDRIFCDIQKGISPNGDDKNDFFDLALMDVKNLGIFNRYGLKVYSKSSYTNQWVGQSDKGDELPDGTYYYVIEFNNGQSTKTGWIYINREVK